SPLWGRNSPVRSLRPARPVPRPPLRRHPCLTCLPVRFTTMESDIAFAGALLAAHAYPERLGEEGRANARHLRGGRFSPPRHFSALSASRWCVPQPQQIEFLHARARAVRPFELYGVTPLRL